MARPTEEEVRNHGDYITTYQWALSVISPASGANFPSNFDLDIRCESATPPTKTINKLMGQIKGHKRFQAGTLSYSNSTELVLFEPENVGNLSWLEEWSQLCTNNLTGAHAPSADMHATILLQHLGRDDVPVWNYTLLGCWPETFTPPAMEGGDGDFGKTTVTLHYAAFDQEVA